MSQKLVKIYEGSPENAEALKVFLKEEGILFMVKNPEFSEKTGEDCIGSGVQELWVFEDDREKAEPVLAKMEERG